MELKNMDFKYFMKNNHISDADWQSADICWEELRAIGLRHHEETPTLEGAAELLAKMLQKCSQVHSVRWRIKNPEHLMEKIVRKRAEGSEKYKSISVSNYADIVTDLIGIRLIHLFKSEWEDIHHYIFDTWTPVESVIAYIRTGDEGATVESYSKNNCEVKCHPAGYRSIHYVIPTQPGRKIVLSEIQVRTIFEEGWSEIDHKIRYPNFSNNELTSYFLTIFNRLAGSADEMGAFVNSLSIEISLQESNLEEIKQAYEKKLNEINQEQEKHLSKIEALTAELFKEQAQSKTKDKILTELNSQVKNLRSNSSNYVTSSQELSLESLNIAKATQMTDMLNSLNIAKSAAAVFDAERLRKMRIKEKLDSFDNLKATLPQAIIDAERLKKERIKEKLDSFDNLKATLPQAIIDAERSKSTSTKNKKPSKD